MITNYERVKQWRKDNPEYHLKQIRRYKKKHPEIVKKYKRTDQIKHKENYRVRYQTRKKYGKLPYGMEYHHTTRPYHIDSWIGVFKEEHTIIEKNYMESGINE